MTPDRKRNQPTVTDWLIGFIWGGMDCVVRTISFYVIGFICCIIRHNAQRFMLHLDQVASRKWAN